MSIVLLEDGKWFDESRAFQYGKGESILYVTAKDKWIAREWEDGESIKVLNTEKELLEFIKKIVDETIEAGENPEMPDMKKLEKVSGKSAHTIEKCWYQIFSHENEL